ncbi:hypothetical protein PUMCH_005001 [Australozyma saopauloensis]|uniref:AHC1-like C2H2 zinc-finger domain-containing protein n=1 Tax=Australozyma saopauloensis TaxID=291208 RepID=A0AAX4HGD3_9ASCO|nr:hypothetical protein PUMCH_005001 [[Candida] saopauloensis]
MHPSKSSTPLETLPPLIDKQSLMEKLELIPAEMLRSILTNQVDLEIRLKHKELKLSEEEIGKCEAQMLALRQFFEVPNELSFRNEPNDFTLKYYDILNRSLSVNYTKLQQQQYTQNKPSISLQFIETESVEPAHSYRTRSTTSSLRPSIGGLSLRVAGCIYRRTDGIIVRLTCPDCHRSNFSSAQGFLNHNRIAHNKEFASQDDAALRCGEVLPDAYQDEEGLASLSVLKEKCLDGSSNLNVNALFFDGFVKSNTATPIATPKLSVVGPEQTQRRKSTSGRTHLRANSFLGSSNDFKGGELPYGLTEGSKELMSKLISGGIAQDSDQYKDLVEEYRRTVPNSHLFDDEEEIIELVTTTPTVKLHTPVASRPTLRPSSATIVPTVQQVQGFGSTQSGLNSNTDQAQLGESQVKQSSQHPETGGKYENRLRRRRPKSDASEYGRNYDELSRRKRRR